MIYKIAFKYIFDNWDFKNSYQPTKLRVTNDSGFSWEPSLVWSGSEFGVSWQDDRDGNLEVCFARINSSGVKQGSDVRITNASLDANSSSLVWAGTEYGLCWDDDRGANVDIYFTRIDSGGTIN